MRGARSRTLAAGLAALLAAAGCGEVASGPRGPVVDSLADATGDGVAVIGEDVVLVGSGLGGDGLRVTIDGREARILERSPSRAVVRVPARSGVGEVAVVASDASGESAPIGLVVRRLAWATNFTDRSVSALSVDGTRVELLGRVPIDVAPGPFAVEFTPDGATAVVACSSGFLPPAIVQALAPGAPPGDTVAIVEVAMFGFVVVKTDAPDRGAGIFQPPSTKPSSTRPVTVREDGVLQIELLPNLSDEPRLVVHIDPRPSTLRMASVQNGETW